MRIQRHMLLALPFLVVMLGAAVSVGLPARASSATPSEMEVRAYMPRLLCYRPVPCEEIEGEAYGALVPDSPPTDRPAALHADLNLSLRGWVPTDGVLGLVDFGGSTDTDTPQLGGLFSDERLPTLVANYRVRQWNWNCNCRGDPISYPAVTLIGLAATPGEMLDLPARGETIGDDYQALVLYADADSITCKYTREDNVVFGYTLHVEGVCVEPRLLGLYQALNAAGRHELPALRARQPFGRAIGSEVKVAIRDTGSFMDPRSQKDWWRGY